jgi:hypothetical protein
MTSLRVGVVCEGPTDYPAIVAFMGEALAAAGIAASFIGIQPDMGRTLQNAEWGNLECWLKSNPPAQRIRVHFDGGLFQRNMSAKACDVLLIQMDSDILDDGAFQAHLRNDYDFALVGASKPSERGRQIVQVLELWSKVNELTAVDRQRHIFAPAVESTETWCVAAFDHKYQDPETLRGAALIQAFMEALETSESRPIKTYVEADKQEERRKIFCEKHSSTGHARIMEACPHFAQAITQLKSAV